MNKKLPPILLILTLILATVPFRSARADSPSILITEVQTGVIDNSGSEFPLQEFIELTNVSPASVNLANWRVEYLAAANNGSGAPTVTVSALAGYLALNGHALISHVGYYPAIPDAIFGEGDTSASGFLAKSGGHIRLMNDTTMIDCVAWGSAVAITGCDKVAAVAPAGYSIQRKPVDGFYDKTKGVANVSPPTPQGGNIYPTDPSPPNNSPASQPTQEPPASNNLQTCDNVELSEILPNPAGEDAAGEYIELHNPTTSIQTLAGCTLRLANGKLYDFPAGTSLAPLEFRAFMFAVTGLQLSNSGTTVSLITATHEQAVAYPSLGDNQSWVFLDGSWQKSSEPTPNASNIVAGDEQTSPAAIAVESKITAPVTCPVGKERNPATNRCKSVGVVAASVQACSAGQERNPATNRCRNIVTAQSTAKPCDPGQERNAETNRCRKIDVAGKTLGASVTKPKRSYHMVLVAIVLALIAAYGVYEYRQEIVNSLRRAKARFSRSSRN